MGGLRIVAVGALLLATLAVLAWSPLAGAEPKIEVGKEVVIDFQNDFVDFAPCSGGQPAFIHALESGTVHFVELPGEMLHVHGLLKATFTVDLLPADGIPDGEGTWNQTLGDQAGKKDQATENSTTNGTVTYADGTTWSFHVTEHLVFGPDLVIKHGFSREHCSRIRGS